MGTTQSTNEQKTSTICHNDYEMDDEQRDTIDAIDHYVQVYDPVILIPPVNAPCADNYPTWFLWVN